MRSINKMVWFFLELITNKTNRNYRNNLQVFSLFVAILLSVIMHTFIQGWFIVKLKQNIFVLSPSKMRSSVTSNIRFKLTNSKVKIKSIGRECLASRSNLSFLGFMNSCNYKICIYIFLAFNHNKALRA